MIDFSSLSDQDLQAIASGDISKVSDDALNIIASNGSNNQQKPSETQVGSRQYTKPSDYERLKSNLIPSAQNLASDIANVFMHPLDTADAMGNLLFGGLDKLTGMEYRDDGYSLITPEQAQQRQQNLELVGQYMKDRYIDNPYENTIQDPVGMGTDILGLLAGGSGLAAKIPRLAKTANYVKRGAELLDPVRQTGRIVGGAINKGGLVASELLGKSTGTGAGAIQRAANSSDDFVRAIDKKSGITRESVVNEALDMVGDVVDKKRKDYQSKMAGVKAWTEPLDVDVVTNRFDGLNKKYGLNVNYADDGSVSVSRTSKSKLDNTSIEEIRGVLQEIEDWRRDPGNRLTPEDFDVLKGRVADFYSENSKSRGFVEDLRKTIRKEISDNVPQYDEIMKDYNKMSKLERELKTNLSLNDKASVDTAFKKLSSTFRQNFEGRNEVLDAVKELGIDADTVLDKVAGLQMRDYAPKGLMGQMATGAGLASLGTLSYAGLINPKMMVIFAATSPRAVGSFLSKAGWSTKQIKRFMASPIIKQIKQGVTTTPGRAITSNMGRYQELINQQLQPQE